MKASSPFTPGGDWFCKFLYLLARLSSFSQTTRCLMVCKRAAYPRGCTTRTGYFKCREVKTGFYRNKSMQTGSSGTLIGWKSGQTTFVPLWDRMEGAWLRTQRRRSWTGDFKCREVKTGFCRNISMQTGSSGTLIGWKSGQTTFVPLWDWMDGAWLRTQVITGSQGQLTFVFFNYKSQDFNQDATQPLVLDGDCAFLITKKHYAVRI